jgi:carbonic anhydrase
MAASDDSRPSSPAAALQALLDGNDRWSTGHPIHPHQDVKLRDQLAREGQQPYAAILACADSRVPAELLFDAGVGDLFVVRVAGNSLGKLEEQSLEYAAEHLHVETIAVIGHQGCGAVKGAVDSYPGDAPEFLSTIYGAIEKARDILKKRGANPDDKDALAKETIDQHVLMVVDELKNADPFKHLIASGKLRIVGGRYDLTSGRVVMLTQ